MRAPRADPERQPQLPHPEARVQALIPHVNHEFFFKVAGLVEKGLEHRGQVGAVRGTSRRLHQRLRTPFGGMGLARTDRSRPFPPDVPVLHEA